MLLELERDPDAGVAVRRWFVRLEELCDLLWNRHAAILSFILAVLQVAATKSDVILSHRECQRRYADIESVGPSRELCVVCGVGLAEVVELEVLGAKSDVLS